MTMWKLKTCRVVYLFLVVLVLLKSAITWTYEPHNYEYAWHDYTYVLTSTLNDSVGMYGFEGQYKIHSKDEIVEIIVQFAMPPSVALRLMQERGIYLCHFDGNLTGASFEEQALSAHEAFNQQLAQLPMYCEYNLVGIFSKHYRLFNGVFMRVPGHMVEKIASMTDVFAVTPHSLPKVPEAIVINQPITPANDNAPQNTFFVNPDLMRASRDLFEMDYIHHQLGITGRGVRVAVLDAGIEHSHPEFARFLDDTGRIPGWQFFYEPGTEHAHGTLATGAVIAMAPEIELWLIQMSTVVTPGLKPIDALEVAHFDVEADVIYTFGGGTSPFNPHTYAVTLAALDGTVVVVAAHNAGPYPYTVLVPSNSPLAIAVGNGSAGSDCSGILAETVSGSSGRGPVKTTHHIKPDIIAPGVRVRTTDVNGGYSLASGTSLSGPVIAGIAALLVQAFPYAAPYEIKARMMNTARPLADMELNSVFAVGAGFVRPLEALTNQVVVTTRHYVPMSSSPDAAFELATMSSLSFGAINLSDGEIIMPVSIKNTSEHTRIFTINHMFTNNPSNTTRFVLRRRTVTVVPGDIGQFDAIMIISNNAPPGFYEGYIYLRDGTAVVARLPFGAVVE